MAIENHHFLFLVSQLVIIPLLFQHSSFAATQLVNQVCQDTQDSDFCVRTLSADQRSGNADLKGLARIALELSSAQAKGTQDQIQTLLSREPGLDFKSVLDHCTINYAGSVYALQQGLQSLDANDYSNANEMAQVGWENGNDCERVNSGSVKDVSLTGSNQIMVKLSDISRVVTAKLENGK
ncbi:hypothetical protein Patl1_03719 [Pistacia atlantica]|uniref:Uncharacterized protein n=1 Tax=Pistacia atlantica TaxID=434234 RepID=A0ACC1BU22_9ROSI|nr:hypothetical protein Patl1_03719 [Pistacia atlantica]